MATLKETVNDMVFKLRIFSSEVTRVSLEVGTMGQLGGQAVVLGVEVCPPPHTIEEEADALVGDVEGACTHEQVK